MVTEALFFDFDGTLGATEVDIRAAWLSAIRKLGLECKKFDHIFRVGPPVWNTAAALFPGMSSEDLAALVTAYKSFYDEAEIYQAVPYPGIEDMLRNLVENGKRIYIVTNKRIKPLVKIVRQFNFLPLCHGLFAPDIVDPEKHMSKAELLVLAIRISGCSPEKALMIGDTELDIQAAHANGIAACGVTWGYGSMKDLQIADPEFIIDVPQDLIGITV